MSPVTLVDRRADESGRARATTALLSGLIDPEWLPVVACLLAPGLVCVLVGDTDRASFFARLALYAGFLKWLGWLILARPSGWQPILMFPAQMIAGLALPMLWFYLRNVVAGVVPGSYSLVELGVVAWLVAFVQVAGSAAIHVRSLQRQGLQWLLIARTALVRSAVYVPFALTLTLTLWSVSKEVFVPSQDGWFHAFIARVYLNDGIFYKHFNGDNAIFYTSGFGGFNAITAAASGLSVVQAHNLQHIFWIVTGIFLITTTVALLTGRVQASLYVLPLLFLSAYPVHNLPPDVYWTHTPQQTASALLVAIPLLSLVLPTVRRRAFYTAVAVQAMLGLLVLALSPVCAFFLPLSCGVALVINGMRARNAFGDRVIKTAAVQAAVTLFAAILVLGSDRFYSTFLLNPGGASYMGSPQFGGNASPNHRLLSFSPERGFAAAAGVEPLELLPEFKSATPPSLPGRFLPWLVIALSAVAAGLAVKYWNTEPGVMRRLAIVAAVASVSWLAIKYGASFVSGGITNASMDGHLLQEYLLFLGRRLELFLLYTASISAVLCAYAAPPGRERRAAGAAIAIGAPATLMMWWLPFAGTHLDPRDGQLVPRNVGFSGKITKDDIELTRWMEQQLPVGQGLIGVANVPFKIEQATFIFPIGAAQSLSLYGKKYNFTFQVFDPGRQYGYSDYLERIVNYFDADWCLKNNIRYFHVPLTDVFPNHGLARARQVGLLEPVKSVSSSAVYAVRPLPWTPIAVPGPSLPLSSNQVRWEADGTGVAEGHDPHVVFALKEPTFVHAIRFKYTLTNQWGAPAVSQLFWSRGEQFFAEHERSARMRTEETTAPQTLTILVHDTIDRFRFDPDAKLCRFKIWDVELLVRPDDRLSASSVSR